MWKVIMNSLLALKNHLKCKSRWGTLWIRMSIMKILMIHLWYDRYGLIFIKIYKVYFDDDYADNNTINNDSNGYYDVINNIVIDKVELIAKMTLKALDIVFLLIWDILIILITSLLSSWKFKGYIDLTHVKEASLRFAFHYFRSK